MWMRDRPTEFIWSMSYDASSGVGSGLTEVGFIRATLGTVDSDLDGLDDGFELWFFDDLSQSASDDFDQDGFSNLEEFNENTSPVVADSDADGRKDGEEQLHGTDPHWPDHPDVMLTAEGGLLQ